MLENSSDCLACSIVYAMSGLPKMSRTFLSGTPLEPPRAQIVHSIVMQKSSTLGLQLSHSRQSTASPGDPARNGTSAPCHRPESHDAVRDKYDRLRCRRFASGHRTLGSRE